jgi:hypothetical protein
MLLAGKKIWASRDCKFVSKKQEVFVNMQSMHDAVISFQETGKKIEYRMSKKKLKKKFIKKKKRRISSELTYRSYSV